MRSLGVFEIDIDSTQWLEDYDHFLWLDSAGYTDDNFIALDVFDEFKASGNQDLVRLQEWLNSNADFAFGYFSYDLKNQIEKLESNNTSFIAVPDCYFFVPRILLKGGPGKWELLSNIELDVEAFLGKVNQPNSKNESNKVDFKAQISKEEYIGHLNKLREHIQLGDVYELNFCQAFISEDSKIDPYQSYHRLRQNLDAPMSAFARFDDLFVLSGSPERYLKKDGERIISEPIKGTMKRHDDPVVDQQLVEELRTSTKDRSENIMIVDLVRNDLSRIAQKGTVHVEEMCEIYSFPNVHQMISRVTCLQKENSSSTGTIQASFPMGSMTGAPKVSAMKLIEEHESFKRGLYSGSLGYFDPDQNFDFNVLIRSLFYDESSKRAVIAAGGAITILSDPESEYEESLLKVRGLLDIMES